MPTDLDDDFDLDDLDTEKPDDTDLVRDLRRQLRSKSKEVNRLKAVEEEASALKREKAFRDAKIDGLTERQMKVLANEHDGDMTPEALRQTAIELGFVNDEEGDQLANDLTEHEQIDSASSGSRAPKGGVITPTMVREWGTDKILKFRAEFPDAFEQIKRGEEVHGITF